MQVFLHGDYRYDTLRNTAGELRQLDEELRNKLINLSRSYPLVIVGYSGRDASVMSALRAAYSQRAQDLYWCTMRGTEPRPEVEDLLEAARGAGNFASIVRYDGFDDLMVRLGRVWLADARSQATVEGILSAHTTTGRFALSDDMQADSDWVLGNGFELELPRSVFEISGVPIPKNHAWQWLREAAAATGISAGLFKNAIMAIGERSAINRTFDGPDVRVREIAIRDDEVTTNSALHAALLSGFLQGVRKTFEHVGRYTIAASDSLFILYEGIRYEYRQSVRLGLERAGGKSYVTFEPDVLIVGELTDDKRKAVKREILWRQRNAEYFEQLKWWKTHLFPDESSYTVTFPAGSQAGAEFRVNKASPVVARMYSHSPKSADNALVRQFRRFEHFRAMNVSEPYLRFAASKSIHPIRGLVSAGGPADSSDAILGGTSGIRVAVICSQGYEQSLIRFLQVSNSTTCFEVRFRRGVSSRLSRFQWCL